MIQRRSIKLAIVPAMLTGLVAMSLVVGSGVVAVEHEAHQPTSSVAPSHANSTPGFRRAADFDGTDDPSIPAAAQAEVSEAETSYAAVASPSDFAKATALYEQMAREIETHLAAQYDTPEVGLIFQSMRRLHGRRV
jgi:hypothetical protein